LIRYAHINVTDTWKNRSRYIT